MHWKRKSARCGRAALADAPRSSSHLLPESFRALDGIRVGGEYGAVISGDVAELAHECSRGRIAANALPARVEVVGGG